VLPPQSAEFDDLVTEAVKKYDAAAAKDLEAYFNWANRSERKQELRLSDYTVYLKTVLAPKFPALAGLIGRLLNTTPTEASVERGFSQMKHCVNDWRNRLDVETVESIIVAKSCYAFLLQLTPRMNSHVQLAELFATEAVEFDLGAGLPSVVAGEPELSDRTG
jgi:hypothetical protein